MECHLPSAIDTEVGRHPCVFMMGAEVDVSPLKPFLLTSEATVNHGPARHVSRVSVAVSARLEAWL